jgi:hypothetical protein
MGKWSGPLSSCARERRTLRVVCIPLRTTTTHNDLHSSIDTSMPIFPSSVDQTQRRYNKRRYNMNCIFTYWITKLHLTLCIYHQRSKESHHNSLQNIAAYPDSSKGLATLITVFQPANSTGFGVFLLSLTNSSWRPVVCTGGTNTRSSDGSLGGTEGG